MNLANLGGVMESLLSWGLASVDFKIKFRP